MVLCTCTFDTCTNKDQSIKYLNTELILEKRNEAKTKTNKETKNVKYRVIVNRKIKTDWRAECRCVNAVNAQVSKAFARVVVGFSRQSRLQTGASEAILNHRRGAVEAAGRRRKAKPVGRETGGSDAGVRVRSTSEQAVGGEGVRSPSVRPSVVTRM